MLSIKLISDKQIARRVCGSFGVTEPGAFAYGAYKDDDVLATAAFLTEAGGCVTLRGVDTGRRLDIALVDRLARTAFSTQYKAGAKTALLSAKLPKELRMALSKLHYDPECAFALDEFLKKPIRGK